MDVSVETTKKPGRTLEEALDSNVPASFAEKRSQADFHKGYSFQSAGIFWKDFKQGQSPRFQKKTYIVVAN